MLTKLERRFVFYSLRALRESLYYDEDDKLVHSERVMFLGDDLYGEINSQEDLYKIVNSIMNKCSKGL